MKLLLSSILGWLRIIAFLEGTSLLVLLFIAMPLKYMWNSPLMVEVVGMAHGVLFLLYIALAIYVSIDRNWKLFRETWQVLVASFIPFGTFYIDYKILAKEHDKSELKTSQ